MRVRVECGDDVRWIDADKVQEVCTARYGVGRASPIMTEDDAMDRVAWVLGPAPRTVADETEGTEEILGQDDDTEAIGDSDAGDTE